MIPWRFNSKNFTRQVYVTNVQLNIITSIVFMTYLFFYVGIEFSNWLRAFVIGTVIVLVTILGILPFTTRMLTHKVSAKIEEWKYEAFDIIERTKLVQEINKVPNVISIEVTIVFIVLSILFLVISSMFGLFSLSNLLYAIVPCILGATISGIFSRNATEEICEHYAKPIVAQRIDIHFYGEKHGFGSSIKKNFFRFVIMPQLLSTFSTIFFVAFAFSPSGNYGVHFKSEFLQDWSALIKSLIIFLMNLVIVILSCLTYFTHLNDKIKDSSRGLNEILKPKTSASVLLDCSFFNEVDYNAYLINEAIIAFEDIINSTAVSIDKISSSSNRLLNQAKIIENSNAEQNDSVKSISNSMKDLTVLSREILDKSFDVSDFSDRNLAIVDEGMSAINDSMENMKDISEATQDTIMAIKMLNEKIQNLKSVVKIIDDIADNTKIIALNAELETVNAGEYGRNFSVVANEIRRLADETVNATQQINDKIDEIMNSSDKLIFSSEIGTESVNKGKTLFDILEKKFDVIQFSAEKSTGTLGDIKLIIHKQNQSCESILVTLQKLGSSIERFSSFSHSLTSESEILDDSVKQLAVITQKKP